MENKLLITIRDTNLKLISVVYATDIKGVEIVPERESSLGDEILPWMVRVDMKSDREGMGGGWHCIDFESEEKCREYAEAFIEEWQAKLNANMLRNLSDLQRDIREACPPRNRNFSWLWPCVYGASVLSIYLMLV